MKNSSLFHNIFNTPLNDIHNSDLILLIGANPRHEASILNLKIEGNHGVYDFEKERTGTFEIDVEIFKDLSILQGKDDLKKTIDYSEVIGVIQKIFNEKRYNLIETLAEKICDNLLNNFLIESVKLRVRKPHAPIQANFETVEVEILRKK